MSKSLQFFNGASWYQHLLTASDILVGSGIPANIFFSLIDKDETTYIYCGYTGIGSTNRGKLIAIDNLGNKRVATLNWNHSASEIMTTNVKMVELRNGNIMLMVRGSSSVVRVYEISTSFLDGASISEPSPINVNSTANFEVYKEDYIWIALTSGTVILYNYARTQIDSIVLTGSVTSMKADILNNLYYTLQGPPALLGVITFDGIDEISNTDLNLVDVEENIKEMIIDKWSDLILISVLAGSSILAKFDNNGVGINTIPVATNIYGLDTDYKGNYYYSNGLETYQITANVAQGDPIDDLVNHVLLRNTGVFTYNNNITGYNPAVKGNTLLPLIERDPISIDFGNHFVPPSVTETFTITGSNLLSDLFLTSGLPAYTLSKDNITFSASLSYTPDGSGNVSETVYVKFDTSTQASHNTNIVCSSSFADNATIVVKGSYIP